MEYNSTNCICVACGKRRYNQIGEALPFVKENYVLCYVTEGQGTFTVESGTFTLKKGQSFLMYPFTNMVAKADERDPWTYRWVEFRGLEISWLINQTEFSKRLPVVDVMPEENFEKLFSIEECKMKEDYAQFRASSKLRLLLSYYLEHFPCGQHKRINYATTACHYIERNYRNPEFGVQSVADYVKIDRTYLYRLFKEETGVSVIDYINNCRITKAEMLLSDADMSIKDIAYSVGFADQMYFSKVFKKIKGETPTEYRKRAAAKKVF